MGSAPVSTTQKVVSSYSRHRPGVPEIRRQGGGITERVGRQENGCSGCLSEVEVFHEVPQDAGVFPNVGPRVGASVGGRVKAGPTEKVVLDELEVGVARKNLVVDVPRLCVRRYDHARDAKAVAVVVDGGGYDAVVEAPPVVPTKGRSRSNPSQGSSWPR